MSAFRSILGNGILVLACVAVGCGKDKTKLVTVQGNVTVGGKSLPRGSVILTPDAEKGNDSLEEPRGEIDAEGNFNISTRHNVPGVAPGWYRVSVNAGRQLDPKDPYFKDGLLHHARYTNHKTSKLAFEVVENPEPGRYDIKLDEK